MSGYVEEYSDSSSDEDTTQTKMKPQTKLMNIHLKKMENLTISKANQTTPKLMINRYKNKVTNKQKYIQQNTNQNTNRYTTKNNLNNKNSSTSAIQNANIYSSDDENAEIYSVHSSAMEYNESKQHILPSAITNGVEYSRYKPNTNYNTPQNQPNVKSSTDEHAQLFQLRFLDNSLNSWNIENQFHPQTEDIINKVSIFLLYFLLTVVFVCFMLAFWVGWK